jgi:exosome complex component MTR3
MLSIRAAHSTQSTVGKELWLDPTEEEAALGVGCLTLACMPALGTITSVWQTGRMKPAVAIEV